MSVSIHDLAREGELLKSNMSRHQTSTTSPTPADTPRTDVWTCRQRLEDVYRQIILLDLDLALEKRVAADLWTFVFRTQISSLLSDIDHQQGMEREETQATLSLFLESVSCFYYQLLHSLCHKHRVSLPNFLSAQQIGVSRAADSDSERRVLGEKLGTMCQDCLLRMGDVARYKGESALAANYYNQAAELLPGSGHICNQLGLVASAQGNFFTAAFHYSHAIISHAPFPPSRSNLEQIFQSHARHFPDEVADTDSFQTGFLYLLSLLYFSRDLSPFCSHLLRLHSPLSSLLQAGDTNHEFILSLIGLCLFACTLCLQPLTGITFLQTAGRLNSEEHQKYQLSLRLLLETTSVLIHSSLSLPPHQPNPLLPFITSLFLWIQRNLRYIPTEQLTQPSSVLWADLAHLVDKLCLKNGFECCLDLTQCLDVELALFGFLHSHERSPTSPRHTACSIEELSLGKIMSAIRSIIKEKLSTSLTLTVNNGVYKLSFTPPPPSSPSHNHPPTLDLDNSSPDLSPVFSPTGSQTPPVSSNSTEYTFFPGIWSNNPDEQTSPEIVLPPVASDENIKSLWNISDVPSP